MNRPKIAALTIACVIVIASLLVTWRQAEVRARATQSLRASEQQRQAARARIAVETERLAAARSDVARMHAALTATPRKTDAAPAPPSSPGSPTASAGRPSRQPSFLELIQEDPEVQSHWLAAQRVQIDTTHGVLFERLRLTAQQIERFKDNVAQRDARIADLRAAARGQGLSENDPVYREQWGALFKDYQTAQKTLLGESGFQEMTAYDRTAYARELVQGVTGAATVAGLGLTRQQTEQLTAAFLQAGEQPGKKFSIDALNWAQFERNAAAFLSERQLQFIKTTEPDGPRGAGWRFLLPMQQLINEAKKADRAKTESSANRGAGHGG